MGPEHRLDSATVPGDGDIVVLDATGINTNITRFNASALLQLVVSMQAEMPATASPPSATARSRSQGPRTDLDIQAGCSLTIIDQRHVRPRRGTTATIAGTLTFNQGFINHLITFAANSTTTLDGSLVFAGSGTGATIDIQYGALIEGEGSITHTFGAMTVNGFIEIEGDVNNSVPITGTGTIKTGGNFNNTSTMFSYPGNPPGEIISGYTWRGLTSTAWETSSNWWAGVVPVSTGDAVIYPAANLPLISAAGRQCRRFYIHNTLSKVTISPSGQLTATGKTTLVSDEGVAGTIGLIIKSDATGSGSFIDNGTISGIGIASVERFLEYGTSGQWHFIGIPMTQINAWTYFDQYLKYYDEDTHHYKYVIAAPGDSILNSDGLGYAIWPNLADFTAIQNGIPNTGTMIIPVSRTWDGNTSDYDGWNLVGNPYTSAIDISLVTAGWNNTDATAWFWDGAAGNFKVYPSGGAGSHSKYCPPGQGFFVHCNDPAATPSSPGSGFVVMNHGGRAHNSEVFLKNSMPDVLKITATGSANSFNDELAVYFDDNLTKGYDPGNDAKKITGDALAPQIFTTSEGLELAVNAQPFTNGNVVVPMSFRAGLPGSYMLSAGETESFAPETSVTLEDLLEGTTTDLRSEPVYTFSHSPADDPARFLLHFGVKSLGTPGSTSPAEVSVYAFDGSIYITKKSQGALSGDVYVFDILGRTVLTQDLGGQSPARLQVPSGAGYYIVKVVTQDGTIVRKVYLN